MACTLLNIQGRSMNIYENLLYTQNNFSEDEDICCNFLLFGHFRNCGECRGHRNCWAYGV